jgi:hypothetical protein
VRARSVQHQPFWRAQRIGQRRIFRGQNNLQKELASMMQSRNTSPHAKHYNQSSNRPNRHRGARDGCAQAAVHAGVGWRDNHRARHEGSCESSAEKAQMNDPMPISDIEIAHSMKRYGGAFIKAVGEAMLHADAENMRKIHEAWPEDIAEYQHMAGMESRVEKMESDALALLEEAANSGYLKAKVTSDETGLQERIDDFLKK